MNWQDNPARVLYGLWLSLLLALTGCAPEVEEEKEIEEVPLTLVETYQMDLESLLRGRQLYEGSCTNFCHGAAPEPGEDVNLFDCRWNYGDSDDDIFRIVTTGIPGTRMVGFGNNFPEGEEDLWKLIAYLRNEQQTCD